MILFDHDLAYESVKQALIEQMIYFFIQENIKVHRQIKTDSTSDFRTESSTGQERLDIDIIICLVISSLVFTLLNRDDIAQCEV